MSTAPHACGSARGTPRLPLRRGADRPRGDESHADAELARIDDPSGTRPSIVLFPPALLSGFGVRSIVEDRSGLLYIGGDRGVQRLDPKTGAIRRYRLADGLPSEDVESAVIDRDGTLWFGTWRGIARLVPDAAPHLPQPSALIGQLRIRGVPYPVSDLGDREIAGLELQADQNQLDIEFFALAFGAAPPRFQYRLEGLDSDWGPLVDQHRIAYASLAPHRYRFLVRAVTPDGVVSDTAAISFVILRPFWQRPWFVAIMAGAALLLVGSLHRMRAARLLGIERMRTRIATDLHDDIGASLSQIAIVSEVVRQRHPDDTELGGRLDLVATTSRELVDAMNDIVWAINPHRDSVRDLVQRMRGFASDVLTARAITFTFQSQIEGDHARLEADLRRHVYLIFKEVINNLARHSGAASATITVSLESGHLKLQVADDGVGFEPTIAAERGHGLANMKARAEAMGGSIALIAAPGSGTRVLVDVPISRRGRRARRDARSYLRMASSRSSSCRGSSVSRADASMR